MESEEIARSHILLSKYTACILTYHLKRKGTDCCKEIVLKAKFLYLCIHKIISR